MQAPMMEASMLKGTTQKKNYQRASMLKQRVGLTGKRELI
jgi:hypothetical protein